MAARSAAEPTPVIASYEPSRVRIARGPVAYEIRGDAILAVAGRTEVWRTSEHAKNLIAADDVYVYALELVSPLATVVVLDAATGKVVQRFPTGGAPGDDFAAVAIGGTRVVMLLRGEWLIGLGDVAPAPREITFHGRLRTWACTGVHPVEDATVAFGGATARTRADGRFELTVHADTRLPMVGTFTGADGAPLDYPRAWVMDPAVPIDIIYAFEYLTLTPAEHRDACSNGH